jgi:aminoglycoside phosphotransferase (APT) family kinase protein
MSVASAAAVATAYGLGRPRRPPAYADRGELGRIWRLDTDRGSWAVKELLYPVAEAAAAADVAFQLAAVAAGVPLPRPVFTRDRTVLLAGQVAGSAAAVLRVYEWVDLVPGQWVTPAEIGTVAADLHRVEHPGAGPVHAWFAEPIGEPAWRELAVTAAGAGAAWAGALQQWLPALIALDGVIEPPRPERVRTCHLDLNLENVRRAPGRGVVVLDWENSGPAQPERELAAILTDLAAEPPGPEGAVEAYRAYRDAGGPARISGVADFSTAVAVQGHLLQLYGRRALDAAESAENRSRSGRRLAAMLTRPLTVPHLDELLAALSA